MAAERLRRGRAVTALVAGILGGVVGSGVTAVLLARGISPLARSGPAYHEVITQGAAARSTDPVVRVVQDVSPAVVNIDTVAVVDSPSILENLVNPGANGEIRRGKGSGFIINGEKGYIVTNNHVVQAAQRLRVTLPDNRVFTDVKVIGTDADADVALIQVSSPKPLPELKLADSDQIQVGETAIAIGNPLIFDQSVTVGVVSAKARELPNEEQGGMLENLIQTDAAINPGNSGGPLLNLQGLVIGMNTAIIPSAQGIGFAVAVNSIKRSVDDILKYGHARRPWIGVGMRDLNPEIARRIGLTRDDGVVLVQVVPGGPAERAGLQRRDVITQVGSQPVHRTEDLRHAMQQAEVDQKLEIKGFRGDKPMTWQIQVGAKPPPEER
jgi:serine protease Do